MGMDDHIKPKFSCYCFSFPEFATDTTKFATYFLQTDVALYVNRKTELKTKILCW